MYQAESAHPRGCKRLEQRRERETWEQQQHQTTHKRKGTNRIRHSPVLLTVRDGSSRTTVPTPTSTAPQSRRMRCTLFQRRQDKNGAGVRAGAGNTQRRCACGVGGLPRKSPGGVCVCGAAPMVPKPSLLPASHLSDSLTSAASACPQNTQTAASGLRNKLAGVCFSATPGKPESMAYSTESPTPFLPCSVHFGHFFSFSLSHPRPVIPAM